MNQNEILKAVRQLAIDMMKHRASDLSKRGARKLLESSPTSGGGVLCRWQVVEKDERKKIAINAILRIVAKTYAGKITDWTKAGDELDEWCDEFEPNAITKPSRQKPEHQITKWVRVHRHKYTSNKGAVRAYIEINGGTLAQLYEIDLKNDLKRNPLSKPE